jgi:hypothetical protein
LLSRGKPGEYCLSTGLISAFLLHQTEEAFFGTCDSIPDANWLINHILPVSAEGRQAHAKKPGSIPLWEMVFYRLLQVIRSIDCDITSRKGKTTMVLETFVVYVLPVRVLRKVKS